MKQTVYKSLITSLLITNIWSVIIFFIYYFEGSGLSLTTLFIYIWSCWFSAGLGTFVIVFSFLKIWKSNQSKIFLLVLVGWLNIFFSILLVITAFLEIIRLEAILYFYLTSNIIVSIFLYFVTRKIIKITEPNIPYLNEKD